MRQLRRSILLLLLALTIFFNIERLDFNQQNVIDIQSFVYVLAIVVVSAALWARAHWSFQAAWPVGLALLVYGVGGLIVPFVGIKAIDLVLVLFGLA